LSLKISNDSNEFYLTGKLLIAMPSLQESLFEQSVIYLCSHSDEGAMGLIINKQNDDVSSREVAEQLKLVMSSEADFGKLRNGGPVEEQRGFVLHSTDYKQEETINVDPDISLTATVDILKKIAAKEGPEYYLIALGYAGWGPGQLDQEIQENSWLAVDANPDLVFESNLDEIWIKAIGTLGITPDRLSSDWGHA
jgi:putative transcriptional regulator